ncbi:hypothetical protein [Caulobacter sp.]|uniref:hypothetical protein n=1 Tax=Caulobacter sp. TaxID=78 RepID=UPI00161CC68C
MSGIGFDDLVTIYRNTKFQLDDDVGELEISSAKVLEVIQRIEQDPVPENANIAVQVEPDSLKLGQKVPIRIGSPKIGIGILARDFDGLINSPNGVFEEPKNFYVIEDGSNSVTPGLTKALVGYRRILELVSRLSEAAALVDQTRRELVFFQHSKIIIPIEFSKADAVRIGSLSAAPLRDALSGDFHKDQKLTILSATISEMTIGQPRDQRFQYILKNLDHIQDALENGYKLFASSFSYAKVRSEIESAKVDYIGKIHRTFVDIQGQMLGIPISTAVIATQLKSAESCGYQSWSNFGLIVGASAFVLFLLIALINQGITLHAISNEISRQKKKLEEEYDNLGKSFSDIFTSLNHRIGWHYFGLFVIFAVALTSLAFGFKAYFAVTKVVALSCT